KKTRSCARVGDGSTCSAEQARKGSTRDASQQRVYQPADNGGYCAAQPDRFELHVNALIVFFEPPVGVKAPEITVRVIYSQLVLVGLASVLHLGKARGIGTAHGAVRSEPFVVDVKVGIDHDRNQRFLVELDIHLEIVAVAVEQLGMAHLGFVDVLVIVVVLDDSKGLRQ